MGGLLPRGVTVTARTVAGLSAIVQIVAKTKTNSVFTHISLDPHLPAWYKSQFNSEWWC